MDQSYYHVIGDTPSLSSVRVKAGKREADGHAEEETVANEDG